MAKHKKSHGKKKRIVFYRKVPGSKRRERVAFWSSGKRSKRRGGTTAVLKLPSGKTIKMRVSLSDCVNLDRKIRCTVTPLTRKRA